MVEPPNPDNESRRDVDDAEGPREADFERASSLLDKGLKSCRAVVANYRAMLRAEQPANDDEAGDVSRYVSTTDQTAEIDPEVSD
jgi:hypothetical protein